MKAVVKRCTGCLVNRGCRVAGKVGRTSSPEGAASVLAWWQPSDALVAQRPANA